MKTRYKTFILSCAVSWLCFALSKAQVATNNQVGEQPATAYSVTERGPHHKVWEKIVNEPGPFGSSFPRKHVYTELATGMHHLVNDEWVDSSDQIQIQPQGGALAQNGQHQLYLPGDLYTDALRLTTPDGKMLTSRPAGLAFADSERNVLIAELKAGVAGQILPSGNQVLYTNICTDCQVDLLVTYKLVGMESDPVIRSQLPNPSDYGFTNASAVRLQWWTEFFNTPEPQKTPRLMRDGSTDEFLDFGAMKIPRGKAFLVGNAEQPQPKILTTKHWVTIQGRTFLVEEIPLAAIASQLANLPPLTASIQEPRSLLDKPRLVAKGIDLPVKRMAKHTTKTIQLAKADYRQNPGFVIDYEILQAATNFTFKSDSTYFVTNSVSLSGNTICEGGSVIKFATNSTAQIEPLDSITFQSSAYRPVVCTAKDDNSVGETISGSSGTPTGFYGGAALILPFMDAVRLQSARFSYLRRALDCSSETGFWFTNMQFFHCQYPLAYPDGVVLNNSLICDATTAFYGYANPVCCNVTFHRVATLADNLGTFGGQLFITNSLLVQVTNNGNYSGIWSNYTARLSDGTGLFQTIGGGSHYLAPDSPYRNAGTTNIGSDLLTELNRKTTYPPLVYSNATITNDITFSPQAQRDTDTPDLGYHYDPLDYVFGGTDANANLTFSPGAAVGWFRTSSGWYHAGHGIHMADGKTALFNGTAEQPDFWVRCSTVQEGGTGLWEGGYGPGGITGWTWPNFNQTPQIWLRFTKGSILAAEANHFRDDNGYLIVHAANCEFAGGGLGGYASLLTYTNCLLDRLTLWTSWDAQPTTDCNLIMQNCLMHGGMLTPNRSAASGFAPYYPLWSVHDSAFDGTSFSFGDASRGSNTVTAFDYNAYLSGTTHTNPPATHDLTITNFDWQAGPLGNYYYPTNGADISRLINVGSTNASLLGLYHFTAATNLVAGLQIKETNSIVDISYHYVAADSSGKTIDTDSDGTPDYLEDFNGNGSVDSGEADWQSASDPGLKVTITRPKNNSTIP